MSDGRFDYLEGPRRPAPTPERLELARGVRATAPPAWLLELEDDVDQEP